MSATDGSGLRFAQTVYALSVEELARWRDRRDLDALREAARHAGSYAEIIEGLDFAGTGIVRRECMTLAAHSRAYAARLDRLLADVEVRIWTCVADKLTAMSDEEIDELADASERELKRVAELEQSDEQD